MTREPTATSADGQGRDRLRVAKRWLTADRAFVALVVAVWAWLYLRGLGSFPLQVWDESRYAVPARNMVRSGDWLVPELQVNTHDRALESRTRLVKPPLVYWLQALAMLVFGETMFAARLPATLATLGSALLVYGIGRRTYDRRAGFAGALVLLVVPQVLSGNHGGRAAVPDAALMCFGSAFVWLTWRGRERPRLLVPAGIAAGLAVMTKGIAAGVFVIAVLPLVAVAWRAYYERLRWVAAGVASTLTVALPWHLYAFAVYRWDFVDQYIIQAAVHRVVGGPEEYVAEPLLWFMNYPYLKNFLVPPLRHEPPVMQVGLVLAGLFVAGLVRRDGWQRHADELALLWWTVAVPLTFVVGGGNKAWYIMPMHVPGAALVGSVPAAVADGTVRELVADRLRGDDGDSGASRLRGAWGRVERRLAGAGITCDHVRTAAYVVICVGLALALATPAPSTVPSRHVQDGDQYRIAQAIAAETPADETVYVLESVNRVSLMAMPFYADRTYERTSLERLRADESIRYAIVTLDRLDELAVEHRVVDRSENNDIAFVVLEGRTAS